jgi:hypothetical protein
MLLFLGLEYECVLELGLVSELVAVVGFEPKRPCSRPRLDYERPCDRACAGGAALAGDRLPR